MKLTTVSSKISPRIFPRIALKRQDIERALIAGAAVLVLILAAIGAPASMPIEVPYSQVPEDVLSPSVIAGPTQTTTVYYADAEGYLVPVTRQIAPISGIAKATLGLMVANDENDLQAARLGLMPVIPENTTFDLDIANGRARIDLSANVLKIQDAETESRMVSAIVQTLTQFDTVDTVEFLIGGQRRGTLTHGTDISSAMSGGMVNLESISPSMSISDASLVRLYFPSSSGRVLVPVTRAVWGIADINTAVFELLRGPKEDVTLHHALPAGTGLIDVSVDNGVVTINFSEEFAKLATASDGGQQALRALMLTCLQYPGVKTVELLVDGKPFSPAALEKPTSVNMIGQTAIQFMDVIEID